MKAMSRRLGALAIAAMMVVLVGGAFAKQFSPWAPAQKIDEVAGNSSELNTPSLDGCPIQSPDGLSLYLASNRPGGKGGLDMGRHAGERRRSLGRSGESRRAGQLGRGRFLPDTHPRQGPFLRQ
jgi:WD40 repeat protein